MDLFPKKENAPNFSNSDDQKTFVQNTPNSKDLIQKEISVNLEEQNLLVKRMQLMNTLINDLPSIDPQYTELLTQMHMDQIELDELKVRFTLLSQQLSE